jgi:hypothetical protein
LTDSVSPDVKVDAEQIKEVLVQEIMKRDVLEGEKAEEAKRKIARSLKCALRKTTKEPSAIVPKEEPEIQTDVIPESKDITQGT